MNVQKIESYRISLWVDDVITIAKAIRKDSTWHAAYAAVESLMRETLEHDSAHNDMDENTFHQLCVRAIGQYKKAARILEQRFDVSLPEFPRARRISLCRALAETLKDTDLDMNSKEWRDTLASME